MKVDNQKLNEKLAKWAGFTRTVSPYPEDPARVAWGGWDFPNGVSWYLPNFTESLDACFKWLVPKATRNIFLSELFDFWIDEAEKTKDFTLALCLAIEKLIEGDKNETNR